MNSLNFHLRSLWRQSPVTLICWGIICGLGLYLASLPAQEFLIRLSIGDALAYPRIAFHVAAGKGSTYNLLTPTNGYHPLWMWLHVPFMLGADSIMARMGVVQVFWIVAAVSAAIAWSLLICFLTRSDLAGGLTALLFGGFGWSLYVLYSGIETPLVFLGLAAVFYLAIRVGDRRLRPSFALALAYGCALAVTFLARLDSAILLLPTIWLAWPGLRRLTRAQLLKAVLLCVLLVCPYFLWNIMVFGHLMPVSGIVKTVSPLSLSRSLNMLANWGRKIAAIGVSASCVYVLAGGIALCALLLMGKLRRDVPALFPVLLICLLGSAAHYLYYLLFMREINVPWHLYPQFLTIYLSLIGAFVVFEKNLSRRHAVPLRAGGRGGGQFVRIAGFLCLTGLLAFLTVQYHAAKQVRRPEAAVALDVGYWIRDHLPETARIAMFDSFYTAIIIPHHVVVDLNGLVEDTEGALLAKQRKDFELMRLRQCAYLVEKVFEQHGSLDIHEQNRFPSDSFEIIATFPGGTAPYRFSYTVFRLTRD